MAKMTLLAIVQNILSDLNSDEINSITDTVEATQIAETVKSVYYDLINDTNYPEHFNIGTLTGLGDLTKPSSMQLPSNVLTTQWVKYDTHTTADPTIRYVNVHYYEPLDFLDRILSRNSTDGNVVTIIDGTGVKLLIQNDKFPEYYTSFNDDILVFDSYNSNEESTLTAARSLIYCSKEPVFQLTNSYIPELDANMFPLLLAEAKSLCFVNNTQSANPKVEQIAKRHQSRKQGRLHRLDEAGRNKRPDFGRRR